MNRLLTLLALVALPVTLLAQKGGDIPGFGRIEKADLEMKECEFDAKADAVVLFDVGELYCGYDFEALPKSMRMIMPDTSISITRRLAAEKNQVSVRIALEFSKPFFSVQEYPDFKEFYNQLFAILSEQIAIKKKG